VELSVYGLMKSTHATESSNWELMNLKPRDSGPKVTSSRRVPRRIAPLPMEWMDPMSWRLPSGKALAEFALQSGFLAPQMLSGSGLIGKKKATPAETAGPVVSKQTGEGPVSTGTFREA